MFCVVVVVGAGPVGEVLASRQGSLLHVLGAPRQVPGEKNLHNQPHADFSSFRLCVCQSVRQEGMVAFLFIRATFANTIEKQ